MVNCCIIETILSVSYLELPVSGMWKVLSGSLPGCSMCEFWRFVEALSTGIWRGFQEVRSPWSLSVGRATDVAAKAVGIFFL